jgi:hypothetical protein
LAGIALLTFAVVRASVAVRPTVVFFGVTRSQNPHDRFVHYHARGIIVSGIIEVQKSGTQLTIQ